jgi:hypothetical protein
VVTGGAPVCRRGARPGLPSNRDHPPVFEIDQPSMTTSKRDEIEGNDEGIDAVGTARLQQESQDLAQQDGRAEARDSDRRLALRELTGPGGDSPQEVPAGAEGLVTWDSSPEEAGHLTQEILPEDEADVSADLADEGRGEAEQDLRRAVNAETQPRHEPPTSLHSA